MIKATRRFSSANHGATAPNREGDIVRARQRHYYLKARANLTVAAHFTIAARVSWKVT